MFTVGGGDQAGDFADLQRAAFRLSGVLLHHDDRRGGLNEPPPPSAVDGRLADRQRPIDRIVTLALVL
ncbi:MAG: hypothetical protein AAFX86_11935 [Pseudomonadota bacterium]